MTAPHIVLLDIGLPFYNGYYWCGKIREVSQVPILFVSSAGDNMNIVMAVNMGGDDPIVLHQQDPVFPTFRNIQRLLPSLRIKSSYSGDIACPS